MFIPIGDDNSARQRTPYVVWMIFAINVVVWLLELRGGEAFMLAYSAIPLEITSGKDLIGPDPNMSFGNELIHHQPGPALIYLTIFSAMFMHGSWLHIIGNMVYLLIFADQIEDRLGHFRFAIFYLLCGVGATLAHIFVAPHSSIPSLGASGAIAGVLGAYLILHPHNRVRVLIRTQIVPVPAVVVLGFWVVLQILGQLGDAGATGGVAYMAHIGGFVAGLVLLPILKRRMN
jgi:membrane associated rhomboid family serine protease